MEKSLFITEEEKNMLWQTVKAHIDKLEKVYNDYSIDYSLREQTNELKKKYLTLWDKIENINFNS